MPREFSFEFTSDVAATPAEVWRHASAMEGVNWELWPFVRMTHPPGRLEDIPLGRVAFQSWLLLGGFIPFDRHGLRLVRVEDGRSFSEESSTFFQRVWRHERTLTPLAGGGCRIVDRLNVEPRISWAAPLMRVIVGALFRHRHRRLKRFLGDV